MGIVIGVSSSYSVTVFGFEFVDFESTSVLFGGSGTATDFRGDIPPLTGKFDKDSVELSMSAGGLSKVGEPRC